MSSTNTKMTADIDLLLTRLCVRLYDPVSEQTIGSGILYIHKSLKKRVLVLTAAHCLYRDKDKFTDLYEEIGVSFYSPDSQSYLSLTTKTEDALFSSKMVGDVAVLFFATKDVEELIGNLPNVRLSRERGISTRFVGKGFPSATGGKELVAISPSWSQNDPASGRFHLHLGQDFSNAFSAAYQVDGFSGSGMFLVDHGQIFLLGIFTRFLEAGKLIICEYLSAIDELLNVAYLPGLPFSFFGSYGLSPDFFLEQAEKSVKELGPRFNAEVNLELPIGHYFNSISRDGLFRLRLAKSVDSYLTASTHGSGSKELEDIDAQYDRLQLAVRGWFAAIDWTKKEKIISDPLFEQIACFGAKTDERRAELYEKRREAEKADGYKEYDQPFSREISHLHQLNRNNQDFLEALDGLHLQLSNNPVMILTGQAGSGKSHLLGDVVSRMNKEGRPALLLLGQLFLNGLSIWQNVQSQLGLSCSQKEFLSAMDAVGKQTQTRALVMIDAINEGAGHLLWRDSISGLIHEFEKYDNVGLVFSIRSTYISTVLPEDVRNNKVLTNVDHQGFRGSEYEAVKLFCERYEIVQPNFPMMSPEYSNPLFLHLVCRGIVSSGDRCFPQGFQGITKVFRHYINAVQQRLVAKREQYRYHSKLVASALDVFAKACFDQSDRRTLTVENALSLFSSQFTSFPFLIGDLIEESVLIRSLPQSYHGIETDNEEFLYFAYERFGDYYIAEELLKDQTVDSIPSSFAKAGHLGKLAENDSWYNDGILEAMSVLLPEKFGLELFEVCAWVYDEERNYHVLDTSMPTWYLNSLKWRSLESIDDKKFVEWAQNTRQFRVDDDTYFNFLFEMCSISGHPFNSDRLTRILKREKMPERDAFLQQFFLYFSGDYDSGAKMPVAHLIEWSWRPGISSVIDQETARLVGQSLAWVLASSHIVLRDRATKAMVNLLQDQMGALVSILEAFADIDDMYILERLYAVAYGCALRSSDAKGLELLAQDTYVRIFESGNPPAHLYLRDYCRHIIELALHRGVQLQVDLVNFRPPYRSPLPSFPTEEEVKKFTRDSSDDPKEAKRRQASGQVHHSVVAWDFGRYEIDPAMDSFEVVPFTFKATLNAFKKQLQRRAKSKISDLEKIFMIRLTPQEKRAKYNFSSQGKITDYWEMIDQLYEQLETAFKAVLDADQVKFFEDEVVSYWQALYAAKNERSTKLRTRPVKYWIVQRVHELGYDGELHGDFDLHRQSYERSGEGKVERIGKKYQWIAYYEILAILADNFKVRERYGEKRSWLYRGPWDVTYRDIDPAYIDRSNKEKYADDDELGIVKKADAWYIPPAYHSWNITDNKWKAITDDLPSVSDSILRTDEQGNEWVYLSSSYTWKEPKTVGEPRYRSGRKEIWYLLHCYLVPEQKYTTVRDWLAKQKFSGRWLPEPREVSNLLSRENYWSPLSIELQKEQTKWRTLEDSSHKVIVPVSEGMGSLSEDKSGAYSKYHMPCKLLFDALDLSYADQDGDFRDAHGQLVATNISPLGCMIKKDVLEKVLSELKLKAIWTLTGEKNAFYDDRDEKDIRRSMSGVYDFEQGLCTGSMKIGSW